MFVENCNVTIKLERNEVWTLANAMSDSVKDRAKNHIEYQGSYIKGFWDDKAISCELDIVRGLYFAIGEVQCYQFCERDIERLFEEAKVAESKENSE